MTNPIYCYINTATEDDLKNIRALCDAREADLLIQKRATWVRHYFNAYLADAFSAFIEVGSDTIIVATSDRNSGTRMAKAVCQPNDKYDTAVGIAVAYAKLCGEHIPDFI